MTRASPLPLLRSPPFPRTSATVAAISKAAARLPDPPSGHDPAILASIAEARVGGTFWAPPATDRRPVLLRPRSIQEAETMIAAAIGEGARPHDMLGMLDTGRDAPLAGRLAEAGIGLLKAPVDPWSLLGPGVRLHAGEGDEWRLIARLAGAETIGPTVSDAMLDQALRQATYRNCFTGRPASIEDVIAILADWRRNFDRTRIVSVAMGMAWWKRDAIQRLLWTGRRTPLCLLDEVERAIEVAQTAGGGIAAWPSRVAPGLEAAAAQAGVPIAQVEDGFIRSVGLGSNLHPPQSIVLDGRGIYYDPSRPSELEDILERTAFTPDLIARGESLARFIVERGISKYARGGAAAAISLPRGKRLVLVTGQVEDDLSVKRAGGAVAGNLDLLRRARAHASDARILFKPHPDVDAGHRVGRIEDAEALQLADAVVRDPIDALLGQVDAVHVLTSLTGFEALLRGREVVVHGLPFYAGWGLTTDLAPPIARRTRRLSLAELVAGTLILYPLYLDPVTRLPCPPEILLERFASGTMPRASLLIRARALQGRIAKRLGKATS